MNNTDIKRAIPFSGEKKTFVRKMSKAEKDIQFAMNKMKYLGPHIRRYCFSKKKLSQHSESLKKYKFPKIHIKRQEEYKKLITQKIQNLFKDDPLKNFEFKKGEGLMLSVVDHHGIINHPISYGANIVSHFNNLFSRKTHNPIITLSYSTCSLGERTHNLGFDLNEKHINIFPIKESNRLVYSVLKTNIDVVQRLVKSKKHILFSKREIRFLEKMNKVLKDIDYSNCQKYSDQVTKINKELWPMVFHKSIKKNVLDLINIEHDQILVDFLKNLISCQKDSFIYQMIFDRSFRKYVLDNFQGFYGTWNKKNNYGTHFFWHIDKHGIKRRLYLNPKNELEGRNFKIQMTPEEILKGLSKRSIIPGMFLSSSIAFFYLGIVPLGGIGSLNTLSIFKNLWVKFMPDDFKKEKNLIKRIKTDALIGIPITYYRRNSKIKELYAFDAIYQGGITKEYLDNILDLSITDLSRPFVLAYNHYSKFFPGESRRISIDKKTIYRPLEKITIPQYE